MVLELLLLLLFPFLHPTPPLPAEIMVDDDVEIGEEGAVTEEDDDDAQDDEHFPATISSSEEWKLEAGEGLELCWRWRPSALLLNILLLPFKVEFPELLLLLLTKVEDNDVLVVVVDDVVAASVVDEEDDVFMVTISHFLLDFWWSTFFPPYTLVWKTRV